MTFVKENQMYKNFGFAILTSENKEKKIPTKNWTSAFFSGFIYCQNAGKVDFFVCLHAVLLFGQKHLFFTTEQKQNATFPVKLHLLCGIRTYCTYLIMPK